MQSWNQVEIVRGLHHRLSAKLESVPVRRECNDKARINVAAQQDERAAIEHAMVRDSPGLSVVQERLGSREHSEA